MNNNIKEDYCSFEVSKLLKEYGFDCECNSSYELSLNEQIHETDGTTGSFGWKKGELNIDSSYNRNSFLNKYANKSWFCCSRPTHFLAAKWIGENFKIHIEIGFCDIPSPKYYHEIYKNQSERVDLSFLRLEQENEEYMIYSSYEEAMDAALLYCLTEILKL